VALAALERALKTVNAPHPIRLQGVSLVSDAEQARRTWPYSVTLENHEDMEILRQVLRSKDRTGGRDDLLTAWTAIRVQRERNLANFIRERLKTTTVHASPVANRVLFVTAPSALSGAEQVLALLNKRLGLQASSSMSRIALVAQPGVLTQRLVSSGADVLVANNNFAANSIQNLLYCRSVLEQVQPSLVHANGLIGVPFTWAMLERGVPLVQHVHVANRGLIELEEQLQCAAAVIAVSGYVRQRLVRCAVDPVVIHVVHNGIEVDSSSESPDLARKRLRREQAIDVRAAIVLMVARFDRNKRHDLVIDAVAKLVARRRAIALLLVGEAFQETDVFEAVRRQISRAGLGNHVRFLGFQRDMRSLYMGSDALVLPAENDAFPQAILEAMSAKLPVVAARSGGAPEMITDRESGLLVEPGDSDALASALDELLSDEQLRTRLAANALYRCLNEFSDSRHVSGILNVYARVLGQS
jgi:glycosyltransferase involved in cell wall biosynthesis